MALPINIDQLLGGQAVEWARLEFKRSWNPEAAIHTICAFANDLENWGGGYLIIGIAEDGGRPTLPPAGLTQQEVDIIQKDLMDLCYKQLVPFFTPQVEPVVYQDKLIVVIWAPGGDNRPYQATISLSKENRGQKGYYVRHFASTTRANIDEQNRLLELTAKIPFDDRINQQASISDLSLGLIREHLLEIKSKLAEEAATMPLDELCRQMHIAGGPPEYFKPLNIGLLMFNEQPDKFFPGAVIEVVIYAGETGRDFTEKQFRGPLPQQLRQALAYLESQVVKTEVHKLPDQAEAQRFTNYPFSALEEALANAVYHRSYELPDKIEVSVRPTRIEILSFPGALPPVTAEQLRSGGRIVSRLYRNRRVGDFLKELHLTEARATGLPEIRAAMRANGSPPPTFDMDPDRLTFLTTLRIHPGFSAGGGLAAWREARLLRLLQEDEPPANE